MYPRTRPHNKHRRIVRVLYFGRFCAFAISDLRAIYADIRGMLIRGSVKRFGRRYRRPRATPFRNLLVLSYPSNGGGLCQRCWAPGPPRTRAEHGAGHKCAPSSAFATERHACDCIRHPRAPEHSVCCQLLEAFYDVLSPCFSNGIPICSRNASASGFVRAVVTIVIPIPKTFFNSSSLVSGKMVCSLTPSV